jgi:hypothetical protein
MLRHAPWTEKVLYMGPIRIGRAFTRSFFHKFYRRIVSFGNRKCNLKVPASGTLV